MRMTKLFTAGATATFAILALTACGGDAEDAVKTYQGSAETSSMPSKSAESKASESAKPSSSEMSKDAIKDVPEEKFTPADGPNARIFQLEDGVTKCFINDIAGDKFLACTTNMVNPPVVQDAAGKDVPANAVSWNPSGVTYETLQFPAAGSMETLHPNERLSALGYTCTAQGPATVQCSGAPGTATLDNGNVTGATVPERKEAPAEPAPDTPEANPGLPGLNLPAPGDLLPHGEQPQPAQ